MPFVEGMIYQEFGRELNSEYKFVQGYLEFNDGLITEIGPGECPNKNQLLAKGVIIPLLTNCHTHIGDAIAWGKIKQGNIETLVSPPDGLKFRILRESSRQDLVLAMRDAIANMLSTGTGIFFDFREQGQYGVQLIKDAASELPSTPLILGRPKELHYSKEELTELLPMVDGIGLSSVSDWEYSEIEAISKAVKKQNKLFALHACERMHEDMDKVLDLHPDFLVHMTYGNDSDFETLAELEIPVVLCSRSNLFFKNIPNIPNILAKGVTLVLGTDNAMINSLNLFEEFKASFKLMNRFGKFDPREIFKMATLNLKKILNPKYYISLAPGTSSKFIVLNIPKTDIEKSLVSGIQPEDIILVNIGDMIWQKNKKKNKS